MTDIESFDDVEAHLRLVLATKAEVMRDGDGADWNDLRATPLPMDDPAWTRPTRVARFAIAGAAVLALFVGIAVTAGGRSEPARRTVGAGIGASTSDSLPFLTFDNASLTPRRPPIGAWSTVPTVSGVQEYNIAGPDGSRRYRWVAFSQILAADESVSSTVTLALSDAADGHFDPQAVADRLECSRATEVRGHPAIVGRDGADGRITYVWREQPSVAAVLTITGYRADDASNLASRLAVVSSDRWRLAVGDAPRVGDANAIDANWQLFEQLRLGTNNTGPLVTTPPGDETSCR